VFFIARQGGSPFKGVHPDDLKVSLPSVRRGQHHREIHLPNINKNSQISERFTEYALLFNTYKKRTLVSSNVFNKLVLSLDEIQFSPLLALCIRKL